MITNKYIRLVNNVSISIVVVVCMSYFLLINPASI